jgi:hypothetical protein
MEKNPVTLSKAIKFVKTSLANQKSIFGSTKNSLAQRQVTFSDTEGTNLTDCGDDLPLLYVCSGDCERYWGI